jgi:hypothetical protein
MKVNAEAVTEVIVKEIENVIVIETEGEIDRDRDHMTIDDVVVAVAEVIVQDHQDPDVIIQEIATSHVDRIRTKHEPRSI